MENNVEVMNNRNITFNNADVVLDKLKSKETESEETFSTMVQGNTYKDVIISEKNIENNSKFIVDLWG